MAAFSEQRYSRARYRRCGKSGLNLPLISLGAWQTFGGYRDGEVAKECLFRAFDLGITHFDFANNYGSPPGNAEVVCGRIIKEMPRDELILSSKAGYHMWEGPYGEWGSRKHLVASCDQSLKRMGVDYFDIFYSHRFDPNTPLEETLGALDTLVQQGKALYIGVSNYDGAAFSKAVQVCENGGLAPITIHQPYFNLLGRGMEKDLAPHAVRNGTGLIAYSPLAAGFLTSKYLDGATPKDSRLAETGGKFMKRNLSQDNLAALRALEALAKKRGQSLAQCALAWTLGRPGITSVLIGASKLSQIEENVAALDNLEFDPQELDSIDRLFPV
ncbi:MAG TPA: aldo/keto reductase [bacterium]|nr:aldo/keto reductase [bacterium]